MGLYYYGFLINEGIGLIFVIQTFVPYTLSVLYNKNVIRDIGKTQKMYHFGVDVMFGSGNFAVTSKVMVNVTMPGSKVKESK